MHGNGPSCAACAAIAAKSRCARQTPLQSIPANVERPARAGGAHAAKRAPPSRSPRDAKRPPPPRVAKSDAAKAKLAPFVADLWAHLDASARDQDAKKRQPASSRTNAKSKLFPPDQTTLKAFFVKQPRLPP